jgi:hypothetical protein
MSDRSKILIGLAVFVILITFPFWGRLLSAEGAAAARPELVYPDPAKGPSCVEDTPYMTSNHMDLLNRWRDDLVRDGITEWVSSSGKTYFPASPRHASTAMTIGMPSAPVAMTTPTSSPRAGSATPRPAGGADPWRRRAAGSS